jgi:N-acetylmuramic acid 6-phosphate etherase
MSKRRQELLAHLKTLATETPNPRSINLDRLSPLEICRIINAEDKTVAAAVEDKIELIAAAGDMAAETLRGGGRLFYIGAGTSGRLGVLDAAECPPTFGTDPGQVIGVIAGGRETLVRSAEGIEDRSDLAASDLEGHSFSGSDMLIGLAASVRTPYTIAGIEYAISKEAKTALIVCNKVTDLAVRPDILIELEVGPEVITGSTRMKSGTAQKMTLNMISTTAMVRLGKCYGNLMVDLQARSEKLAARSRKILIELFDINYETAEKLLVEADGSVKTAIVMHVLGLTIDEAQERLDAAGGALWKLLDG